MNMSLLAFVHLQCLFLGIFVNDLPFFVIFTLRRKCILRVAILSSDFFVSTLFSKLKLKQVWKISDLRPQWPSSFIFSECFSLDSFGYFDLRNYKHFKS